MTDDVFRFMGWVNSHYGTAGMICVLIFAIMILIGILWLIQRLPIPKDQALCDYCRY